MNLRDLRYLVVLSELKHYTQAAKHCHISQPTLSAQIKKLEATLDVTLFEKSKDGLKITEVGQHIVDAAKRILLEEELIKRIAEYARDPLAGNFRLGAFPTLAPYLFPNLVQKIKRSLPRLRLILVEEKTEQLINQLLAREIDAAFLALPISHKKLQTIELFKDEFLLAVPQEHPLSQVKQVTSCHLTQEKLLLLDEGHCLREQALQVCERLHMSEYDFKGTSLETLRQMVVAGTGMTLMPEIAILPSDAGIIYVPFSQPAPFRTIGLVYQKGTPREKMMDLIVTLFKSE